MYLDQLLKQIQLQVSYYQILYVLFHLRISCIVLFTIQDSNQMNVPLIVGISLLALLVALCCSASWLYYLKRYASKLFL